MRRNIFMYLIAAIALSGCSKDNNAITTPTGDTPASLMLKYINSELQADYTVLVSSARGFSVYEESLPIDQSAMSGIEAYSKELKDVGKLLVNDKNVPFKTKTYNYQIDIDSTTSTTKFTGIENTYSFLSSNPDVVPSFEIKKYSPAVNSLRFEGIIDKKINAAKGFILNWAPDPKLPDEHANGLIVLAARIEGKDPVLTYFEVSDRAGNYVVTKQDLEPFVAHGHVIVHYARGYSSVEEIENKNIEFQFLTYGWAHLLFED